MPACQPRPAWQVAGRADGRGRGSAEEQAPSPCLATRTVIEQDEIKYSCLAGSHAWTLKGLFVSEISARHLSSAMMVAPAPGRPSCSSSDPPCPRPNQHAAPMAILDLALETALCMGPEMAVGAGGGPNQIWPCCGRAARMGAPPSLGPGQGTPPSRDPRAPTPSPTCHRLPRALLGQPALACLVLH